jgi:hypothetical protein
LQGAAANDAGAILAPQVPTMAAGGRLSRIV